VNEVLSGVGLHWVQKRDPRRSSSLTKALHRTAAPFAADAR